jgi:aminoglycoside phosphotransferase (APT) family kinase protein
MARLDADALAVVVGRHLGQTVTVEALRRMSGGASRETWSFDAVDGSGARRGLVLRRDPGAATLGSDRGSEYQLVRAAGEAGVPVPRVRFLLDEGDGLGSGFVMDLVEGETIPRKILRDDRYASARPHLAVQCGEIAARIHAVDVGALPPLATQGARDQIAQYRGLLDDFGEPLPAFELGLRWLDDHAPPVPAAPTLVHGDFRNGNFIVGPEGIRSVLDWELAHLGDPVEDLGWLCVKAWRFGHAGRRAGGFGSADELLAGYVAGGGREVDPEHLRFWETLGTLKWGVICLVQTFTHLDGIVRSVELATLGRRVAENEWDLFHLLAPEPPTTSAAPDPGSEPHAADVGDRTGVGRGVRPTAAELAEAVREFLERDVMDAVDGWLRFHTRVAANALGMLEREARFGPALAAAERARLAALVGRDGTLAELAREVAAGIRSGALDDRHDEVVDAVRESVRAKLAIANPGYR